MRRVRRERARRAREGMTLIEMMVVVIIIALAATGLGYGLGALERTQLRSACMKITAGVRYAYNRSIAQGTTVRLVFDLEQETMGFEEAHGRVTLARANDERRAEIAEDGSGDDISGVDPWAAAQARIESTLRPSFGASPFSAIEGRRYEAHPLGRGITIERLITPHEPEPRQEGRGSIYFFPGGQTEHAVIWLSDGGDRVFSVEIHPLTGRTRVRDHAWEPDELLDQGTSEVRD
ncbi:pilus assembly FimT family protein [Sandaracinus amylolyticus]|nr:prepilin-type N-terminal cleavage/methylation domain-containing protein [Sandaracinus amylolyticus]